MNDEDGLYERIITAVHRRRIFQSFNFSWRRLNEQQLFSFIPYSWTSLTLGTSVSSLSLLIICWFHRLKRCPTVGSRLLSLFAVLLMGCPLQTKIINKDSPLSSRQQIKTVDRESLNGESFTILIPWMTQPLVTTCPEGPFEFRIRLQEADGPSLSFSFNTLGIRD